ncbi:MAG: hypothetical protein ACXWWL_07205 [Candidatus Limnocylindria bacterium]
MATTDGGGLMATNRIIPMSVAALLMLCVLAGPATANIPDSFTACIGPVQSDYCSSGDTYLAGDNLWFQAEVQPPHAGMTARVLMKEPGNDTWERVGSDTVSDVGELRWTWRTDVSDADVKFYRLKWKIPGHGKSEVATVQLII